MRFHIYFYRFCSITEILCEKLQFFTELNLEIGLDIGYISIYTHFIPTMLGFGWSREKFEGGDLEEVMGSGFLVGNMQPLWRSKSRSLNPILELSIQ